MRDPFPYATADLESPAATHFAITPNDGADLPALPRALFIGTGGTSALRDAAGVNVTYTVQDGQILPFRAARVLATGTTAASIVGWF